MKAVRIHAFGGAGVLQYEDAPLPEPGPTEVRVRVQACGINPVDWKIRAGHTKGAFPSHFPQILGWDIAGIVDATGPMALRYKPGDAVYARPDITRPGGYAEYIVIRADELALMPGNMSPAAAAGVPLAGLTAWMMLFDKADLRPGQKVLIHGGSGGVGTYGIQLAKAAGAYVITTTSAKNTDLVRSLGADEVIDYRHQDFSQVVKDLDVVLDTIGGDTLERSYGVLRRGGAITTTVARPDEAKVAALGLRAGYGMVQPNGARLEQMAKLIERGQVRTVIDKIFPLQDVREAHAYSETGRAAGKIILQVS